MATIAEMFVDIGADASQFEREANDMQKQMGGLQSEMRTMADTMGTSSTKMAQDWKAMSAEMQSAMRANTEKMKPFKQAQQEVQYGFFKMAQGMKDYQGSTGDFMTELEAMGKKHKTATDNMLKNNDAAKMSFIQSIAVMSARSTQAEKIAANFTKMGNPLYTVNNGLLSVAGSMNKIAMAGSPARLALEMLGPTANMKDLRDMTMMIQQGLMRFTMVSIIAGVAAVGFYSNLHSAALEAVPGYKKATEEMSKATEGIFKPMAELFGLIMTPIVELITFVAQLAQKFNEAHPVLAKIIQGFIMLIPLLTLILSPLAIGIGWWAGLKAAMFGVWVLIGPVVTGFAAIMGTVLVVAAAITALGVVLWALWTKTDWFKDAVIGAWEAIKAAAIRIWNAIYFQGIKPAIDALMTFIQVNLLKLQLFWYENGEQIMKILTIVWGFIKTYLVTQMAIIQGIIEVAWTLIKNIIVTVWNVIKIAIETVFGIIGGIIKFWLALFKGDFSGAWEAIKGIWNTYLNGIRDIVKALFEGYFRTVNETMGKILEKIKDIWNKATNAVSTALGNVDENVKEKFDSIVSFITGLGQTFFNAGKGLIEMIGKGIENAAGEVVDKVKDVAGKIRDMLPFSPAKDGPLSDLDRLDFGGPIADSLKRGIPTIQRLMSEMVTMPSIVPPTMPSYSSNAIQREKTGQTVIVELDGRQIARGTLPHMEREIRLKTGLVMG
jgi:phage-related protein